MIGTTLHDRYRIKAELGRGGMAVVYRAHDDLLQRDVAVKVLTEPISEPQGRARWLREARAAAILNHPNVVAVYDAGEVEATPFIVMELVEGPTLHEQPPQNLDEMLIMVCQVCGALEHAHARGIIHRDLKPENVLLTPDGGAKLVDFGLARSLASRRISAGAIAGTVFYLAPEQCMGGEIDARADLYALGVMLYEWVAGRLPFLADDPLGVISQHLHAPVVPPSTYNAELAQQPTLEDLIVQLLSKRPEDRPASATDVLHTLEGLLPSTRAPSDRPPGSPAPRKHNLPPQPTAFIGRRAELAALTRLLADPDACLVTVLGAGGTGKTRLALEVAAAQLERYADGVFFVSLAPLQTAEEIVPAVARALGFSFYAEEGGMGQERRAPKEQLLDYVRRKQLLLVMDNFEHLLPPPLSPAVGGMKGGKEGGTQLVAEILQKAPRVQILVTSRARLNLQGEHLFQLAGMRYPERESGEPERWRAQVLAQLEEEGAAYSAVQLFVAAAGRAQAGFELAADNVEDVVQVCRLVGGMPLGLLLAAAWTELLTPGEIADEIEQSLDFLETELRDVPERQRSLRATFDHSWRLLTGPERELLAGLAVFRGGLTRGAAGAVTGATLRELMSLVNKSLLERDAGGRYRLHELIRQYAAQRLRAWPELDETAHDGHCAFFIATLHEAGEAFKGPRQQAALAEMDLEIENARAAWDWAVARGQVERLDQALEGLCLFYSERRRPTEGEAACRLAVEKLWAITRGTELRTLAPVLAWQATFSRWLEPVENAELAHQLLAQSMELLERPELAKHDTRRERAFVLRQMGLIAVGTDLEAAQRWHKQSLDLYRALGEPWWTANTQFLLSDVTAMLGFPDQAKRVLVESLELRRALGDRRGIAQSLAFLSLFAAHMEPAQAEGFGRESITILRELGDQARLASALYSVGLGVAVCGNFAEGHALLEESVAINDDLGIDGGAAWVGVWSAWVALHLGQYAQAQYGAQNSLEFFREQNSPFSIACSLSVLGMAALAGAAPAEAAEILEESVTLFRQLKTPETLSRELAILTLAKLGLGEITIAQRHLAEALQIAIELQTRPVILYALAPAAPLLAALGQPERAVELYALASRYPLVANSRWFEDRVGRQVAAASASLPPDRVAAAQERGRARDLEGTVEELLAEFKMEVDSLTGQ